MNVHFIAIGGSAMHNLAIALKIKGYHITGSDDEIVEPSKSRLLKFNILPAKIGWDKNNIHGQLDAVIVGMHARADNPELLEAKKQNIPIYSYPEYVYEQCKRKNRVVIGGSHGKTTITSMILHVLKEVNLNVDYLVGAQLEGYDCMVQLSDAKTAILEGDEYLSSPIDPRPKFHLYKGNVAVLNGIAWDHINVFPTMTDYVKQFELFIESLDEKAVVYYYIKDRYNFEIVTNSTRKDIKFIGYTELRSEYRDMNQVVVYQNIDYPIQVFGDHNLQNMQAAILVCTALGVSPKLFLIAIGSFTGASKRLELIEETKNSAVYKDFAHSPSKLKATTSAVKAKLPKRYLIACMELHTFSSLTKTFLQEYGGTMEAADEAIVYYNPHTLSHKKLENINEKEVEAAFKKEGLKVFTDSFLLINYLKSLTYTDKNLLLMSSGNFDGIDLNKFGKELLN